MSKTENEAKQSLFEQCYRLIHQDRIPLAAATLSRLSPFTLREFFDFCDMKDKQTGKEGGTTQGLLAQAVADEFLKGEWIWGQL